MRLYAGGVCHSDLNAIDGTAPTPLPGRARPRGRRRGRGGRPRVGRRRRPACTSCSRGCRRAAAARSACASCRTCARRHGPRWRRAACSTGRRACRATASRCSTTASLSTFAERTVVPAACCVPIPDDVPWDVAALVGCAITTGTGAVWRTAGVRPGDRVCVYGCGGVGMSAVLGALAVGADPVVAVDVAHDKLEAALRLGATAAVRVGRGRRGDRRTRAGDHRRRRRLRVRGHRTHRGRRGRRSSPRAREGRPC